MNVRAIGPWLLVRQDKRDEKQGSVIIAVETGAERVGFHSGVVVDIAEKVYCDIADRETPLHTPDMAIGDRILYRRYLQYAHEIDVDGVPHSFIHWWDVLAVIDPDTQLNLGGMA